MFTAASNWVSQGIASTLAEIRNAANEASENAAEADGAARAYREDEDTRFSDSLGNSLGNAESAVTQSDDDDDSDNGSRNLSQKNRDTTHLATPDLVSAEASIRSLIMSGENGNFAAGKHAHQQGGYRRQLSDESRPLRVVLHNTDGSTTALRVEQSGNRGGGNGGGGGDDEDDYEIRFLDDRTNALSMVYDNYDPETEYRLEEALTEHDLADFGVHGYTGTTLAADSSVDPDLIPLRPDGLPRVIPELPPHIRVLNVFLAFMRTDFGSKDQMKNIINRAVSAFSDYTHCEIIFIVENAQTGRRQRWVSSIHAGHQLRFVKNRVYYKPRLWSFYHYNCSDAVKRKTLEFEYAMRNTSFNRIGFIWNFYIPFDMLHIDPRGRVVFCSEAIVRNFRYCEPQVYASLAPYSTHPSKLLDYVMNNVRRFTPVEEPTKGGEFRAISQSSSSGRAGGAALVQSNMNGAIALANYGAVGDGSDIVGRS